MTPTTEEQPALAAVLTRSCARLGLDEQQTKALEDDIVSSLEEGLSVEAEAKRKVREAAMETLSSDWGEERDAALTLAARAAQAFGLDDDDVEDLLDLGEPVKIVAALARLGVAMQGQEQQASGERSSAAGAMTAEAAQAELVRLNANPDHRNAFLNRAHPGHLEAKRQRARLVQVGLEAARG